MTSEISLKAPISRQEIDRIRLSMRKQVPKIGIGAHLHRRMGQSLDFREFREYVYGDDIRKVDWAASQRRGMSSDLTIRAFEAEERRVVLIILDCRPTMMLPNGVEKFIVAGWLAQCLANTGLAERDIVYVGSIYGKLPPFEIKSGTQIGKIENFITSNMKMLDSEDNWMKIHPIDSFNLTKLLKPSSVVILISDMLMRHELDQLAKLGKIAQESYRSFHIIEINSWPLEKYIIESGTFKLNAIEDANFDDSIFVSRDEFTQQTAKNLNQHRKRIRKLLKGRSLIWPDIPFNYSSEIADNPFLLEKNFSATFRNAHFLPSLLSRSG